MARKITPADFVEHWSTTWNTTTVIAGDVGVVLRYDLSDLANFLHRHRIDRDAFFCRRIADKLNERNEVAYA